MGGPCLQYVRPPYGEHEERLCPPCTDNFQVVPGGFEYDGILWHSVEQAFQSLKFPIGSIAQIEIERTAPRPDESETSYSMRTWSLGQPRRDTSMHEDWEQVKVKVMTVLNIAKYASSVDFCFDLIETGTNRILGQPSTWKWPYWNAAIQTYIRTELHKGTDLHELLQIIDVMEPEQVELLLSECYDFNASSEAFRTMQQAPLSSHRSPFLATLLAPSSHRIQPTIRFHCLTGSSSWLMYTISRPPSIGISPMSSLR